MVLKSVALISVAQDTYAKCSLDILVLKNNKLTAVTDRARCAGNAVVSTVLTVAYSALATLATAFQIAALNQVNFFNKHAQKARDLALGNATGTLLLLQGIVSPSTAVRSVKKAIVVLNLKAKEKYTAALAAVENAIDVARDLKLNTLKEQLDNGKKDLVTVNDINQEANRADGNLRDRIDRAFEDFNSSPNNEKYVGLREMEKACSKAFSKVIATFNILTLNANQLCRNNYNIVFKDADDIVQDGLDEVNEILDELCQANRSAPNLSKLKQDLAAAKDTFITDIQQELDTLNIGLDVKTRKLTSNFEAFANDLGGNLVPNSPYEQLEAFEDSSERLIGAFKQNIKRISPQQPSGVSAAAAAKT